MTEPVMGNNNRLGFLQVGNHAMWHEKAIVSLNLTLRYALGIRGSNPVVILSLDNARGSETQFSIDTTLLHSLSRGHSNFDR